MSFDGKVVLITGGSSGIGKRLAADLLGSGARVVIASDRSDRLAQAVRELAVISTCVTSIVCDVGDRESVLRMKDEVLDKHGCPDILVNCAGFATYRTVEGSDLEELERLISVNFMGAMRCTRAFLPSMAARQSGTLVNIASIAGRMIITPNSTYGAAKHALVAWSEALKYELARFNIHVNVICPGRVELDTSFFEHETFRNRAPRVETRLTITVGDVSRATLQAIARNRFLTYVPWTLGLGVWLTNAFPFLVKPIYGRLLRSRIESIYTR